MITISNTFSRIKSTCRSLPHTGVWFDLYADTRQQRGPLAAPLFLGMLYNWFTNPTRGVLQRSNVSEYGILGASQSASCADSPTQLGHNCIDKGNRWLSGTPG